LKKKVLKDKAEYFDEDYANHLPIIICICRALHFGQSASGEFIEEQILTGHIQTNKKQKKIGKGKTILMLPCQEW
jgi:hypothetical protein